MTKLVTHGGQATNGADGAMDMGRTMHRQCGARHARRHATVQRHRQCGARHARRHATDQQYKAPAVRHMACETACDRSTGHGRSAGSTAWHARLHATDTDKAGCTTTHGAVQSHASHVSTRPPMARRATPCPTACECTGRGHRYARNPHKRGAAAVSRARGARRARAARRGRSSSKGSMGSGC